jgi:hypothetical protein
MRFTERELTLALQGAAKSVLAVQDKTVRKGQRTADDAWEALSKYQRFQLMDGLGDQLLPVLVGLPDQEVAVGERPTYSDDEVARTIEERDAGSLKGIRGKVVLKARVSLVQLALSHVPPRADPDALIVPDHL